LETQDEEIKYQTKVLGHERGELKTTDDTVRVGMVHVFVIDNNVVLGCHVIGDVVIHD
jgi:hypothetical protein